MNCHWSWYSLVTHALLVENYKNDAKRYIRDEFCRYISHDSDGVCKILKMNFEWSDLVQGELSITPLIKKSEAVLKTVTTWHQESRNICLIMRRDLSVFVPLKMPHSHQTDPVLRLKVNVDKLVTEFELTCTLGKPEIVPW